MITLAALNPFQQGLRVTRGIIPVKERTISGTPKTIQNIQSKGLQHYKSMFSVKTFYHGAVYYSHKYS